VAEVLLDRIRKLLARRRSITEKRMFGGTCFFVNGNMIAGVSKAGELMVRVGKQRYESALEHPDASEMDFTGRPMRGFVSVLEDGIADEDGLKYWIDLGLKYARSLPAKEKKE
jgi:TfoX/Sxy family transcriptional regulator of competence genes